MNRRYFFCSLLLYIGLGACVVVPAPRCDQWAMVVPQIGVKEYTGSYIELPDDTVVVFGRISVRGTNKTGALSVRLIQLDGTNPVAEEEIWIGTNGQFEWLLPAQLYRLQPIYFHHEYFGTHYNAVNEIDVSVEFDARGSLDPVYIGVLNIHVSADFQTEAVSVNNDLDADILSVSVDELSEDIEITPRLMRYEPRTDLQTVSAKRVCKSWVWRLCAITGGGGGCAGDRYR